ncbi:CHAT domain-containing protein, partial [Candidatus Neomarinimicrobiota bacterium]
DVSEIEDTFINELKLNEDDLLKIANEPPHLIEYASFMDTAIHKKYFMLFDQYSRGNWDYYNEIEDDLLDPSDTSDISLNLYYTAVLFEIYYAPYENGGDKTNFLIETFDLLGNTLASELIVAQERTKLLIEYFQCLMFIEKYDYSEEYDFVKKWISAYYEVGSPIFGFYCSTMLAEKFLNMGKFHKAEKEILEASYLLNKYSDRIQFDKIEYSYFLEAINRQKLVLAASISKQRPADYTLELFKNTFKHIENGLSHNENSYIEYITRYRPYNEMAIEFISKYSDSNPILADSTQNTILSFIERNKARIFKRNTNTDWISSLPNMQENEVGLNYIIGFNSVLCQIYTSDTCITFSSNNNEITHIWDSISNQIQYNIIPDDSLVNYFSDLLIPIKYQSLLQNKKVFISPDGIISTIPFQYIFSIIPSFSFFNRKTTNKETLFAVSVSNPSYFTSREESAEQLLLRNNPIAPLSYAHKEIQSIEQIYKSLINNDHIIKIDATETWVKNNIQRYDIVHFATHSVPYLSEFAEGGILLKSTSNDDGILSVSEIMDLNLKNSLVFLSSCESGVGDYLPGEGINSIARSLLFSGAEGVIASLWPVSDKYTKQLVEIFYTVYFQNRNPALSLYMAQDSLYETIPPNFIYQSYPFVFIRR